MNKNSLEKVLGRKEYDDLVRYDPILLRNKKVLVTGANGSIGQQLVKKLKKYNIDFLATDIEGTELDPNRTCKCGKSGDDACVSGTHLMTYLDITDEKNVIDVLGSYQPDIIVNIAGAKHAPEGEHETWKTLSINTIGTKYLIDHSNPGTKIILTSTCKSCNPETVYGSSKLIAERMIMNYDNGSIVRFFNVVETQGNVFEIWENVPQNEPIKVVDYCKRYFISVSEAVGLILYTAVAENGRYIVNSTNFRKMGDIASALYPDREKTHIIQRRGDRVEEKFLATHENIESYELNNSVIKIKNNHDK